jgi:hypothetical protein
VGLGVFVSDWSDGFRILPRIGDCYMIFEVFSRAAKNPIKL